MRGFPTAVVTSSVVVALLTSGCIGFEGGNCLITGIQLFPTSQNQSMVLLNLNATNASMQADLANASFFLYTEFVALTSRLSSALSYFPQNGSLVGGLGALQWPDFIVDPRGAGNYSFYLQLSISSNSSDLSNLVLFGEDNRVDGWFVIADDGLGFTAASRDFTMIGLGPQFRFTIVDDLEFVLTASIACP